MQKNSFTKHITHVISTVIPSQSMCIYSHNSLPGFFFMNPNNCQLFDVETTGKWRLISIILPNCQWDILNEHAISSKAPHSVIHQWNNMDVKGLNRSRYHHRRSIRCIYSLHRCQYPYQFQIHHRYMRTSYRQKHRALILLLWLQAMLVLWK